jgi:ABC-type lipoprotein export system ATPase subunit
MSLLELRHVCKHRTRGGHRVAVLEDASLSIEAGELVAVWGMRGSGRTTFLRLAAGVELDGVERIRLAIAHARWRRGRVCW